MTITTITAHVEPHEGAALDSALALPFALAEAHHAAVTALVFPIEMALAETFSPNWDLAAREASAVAHVRSEAERRGVACEIRPRSSFAYGAGEVVADQFRVSDLGVLFVQCVPSLGQRMLLNAALFDSGRPVLLAPDNTAPTASPTRIVIAWDGTPAAVRAVHGALPFLRVAAETHVVTVTDDKEMRPGQSGIELTRLLARHGARASFAAVPRGARSVLAALAEEGGASAWLAMGVTRHSPLRNMVFGSATQDLLEAGPPVPVLAAA